MFGNFFAVEEGPAGDERELPEEARRPLQVLACVHHRHHLLPRGGSIPREYRSDNPTGDGGFGVKESGTLGAALNDTVSCKRSSKLRAENSLLSN